MPDPFERHARGPDDWSGNPGRGLALAAVVADQLADPAPAKLPPAPKNTRDNCKGKPGRPHIPVIALPHTATPVFSCKWTARYDRDVGDDGGFITQWSCWHRERCERCEKVIREGWQLTRAECDAYPGDPAQQAATEADAAAWTARPRRPRRPAPDGPQGYRRPKAGGQ
jgi:hypothetical protein